jgi:hypothetical protein
MAAESPLPQSPPVAPHLFVPAAPAPHHAPAKPPFNPGWVTAVVAILSALIVVGGTYRDVADLREWQRGMETWRNERNISDAKLQKDVEHIKASVDEMKGNLAKELGEMKQLLTTGTLRK